LTIALNGPIGVAAAIKVLEKIISQMLALFERGRTVSRMIEESKGDMLTILEIVELCE
jgi:hypothetical protein